MATISRSSSRRAIRHSAVYVAWQVSQQAAAAGHAAERARAACRQVNALAAPEGATDTPAVELAVRVAALASTAAALAVAAAEAAHNLIEATHAPLFAGELGITVLHPHSDDPHVEGEMAEHYTRASRAHRDADDVADIAETLLARVQSALDLGVEI